MAHKSLAVFLALPLAATAGGYFEKGCPSTGSRPDKAAFTDGGSKFTYDDFKQQGILSSSELAVSYKRSSPAATLVDISLKIYRGKKLYYQTARNPSLAKDRSPDGDYVLDADAAKRVASFWRPGYTFILEAMEKQGTVLVKPRPCIKPRLQALRVTEGSSRPVEAWTAKQSAPTTQLTLTGTRRLPWHRPGLAVLRFRSSKQTTPGCQCRHRDCTRPDSTAS